MGEGKMRVKGLFVALAIVAASTAANAGEGWICVEELSAGLRYFPEPGKWKSVRLIADDKYLIRKWSEDDFTIFLPKNEWVVLLLGNLTPDYTCGSISELGYLNCTGIFGTMHMNPKTLRFVNIYNFGYIDGRDEPGNTPSISAGTCAPM